MRNSVSRNWVGRAGGQPAFRRAAPQVCFPHTDFGSFSRLPDGFVSFEAFASQEGNQPDAEHVKAAREELASRSGVSSLAALRLRRGLSQAQIAKAVGTSQPRLSMWERGTEVPTVDSLRKLKAALAVSYDELMKALDD